LFIHTSTAVSCIFVSSLCPQCSSVRILSFAKTYPLPKRTSGGKPVQGHGSVALTNPAQGEFASKKCSNMF
jgi:hypothetical protein